MTNYNQTHGGCTAPFFATSVLGITLAGFAVLYSCSNHNYEPVQTPQVEKAERINLNNHTIDLKFK